MEDGPTFCLLCLTCFHYGNRDTKVRKRGTQLGHFCPNFHGEKRGRIPTCAVSVPPPFLQAELQPLFCSTPHGILSPSTMKSVTFKLPYCNLGTSTVAAVTPRWAPSAQRLLILLLVQPSVNSGDRICTCFLTGVGSLIHLPLSLFLPSVLCAPQSPSPAGCLTSLPAPLQNKPRRCSAAAASRWFPDLIF